MRLQEARDERQFGGKAVSLGVALRSGLAVPGGYALGVDVVDAVASEPGRQRSVAPSRSGSASVSASAPIERLLEALSGTPVAVRSSAVGEDSASASFAGQHLTRLNVVGEEALLTAVREVWASGRTPSALAYRRRLGIAGAPQVAVVVQRMVFPRCAGVLFTRDPVTGADERVIEGTWGLGEAVVSGLVTPDRWRMRRGGEVLEEALGDKDIEIVWTSDGGTVEREVDAQRVAVLCLDAARLAALESLAACCERVFSGPSDIEWAFEGDDLFLLQRRVVTR